MFIIPDHDVATHPNPQSIWFQTDIEAIVRALQGTAVIAGCAVTPQSPAALGVTVASGTVQVNGNAVAVTGANVTILTADGDPRIDLIVADSVGTLTAVKGTAAVVGSTTGPKPPDIPANKVLLAMVVVLGGAVSISSAEITDKRVPLLASSDALAGTRGTPSDKNRYVTNADPRMTDPRDPREHAYAHEAGGHDELDVTGLPGRLAEPQMPAGHGVSHRKGGTDQIKLDDLAVPDDNTDLNTSTTRHGLQAKATNNAEHVYKSDATQGYSTTLRADQSGGGGANGRVVLPVGVDKWAT